MSSFSIMADREAATLAASSGFSVSIAIADDMVVHVHVGNN